MTVLGIPSIVPARCYVNTSKPDGWGGRQAEGSMSMNKNVKCLKLKSGIAHFNIIAHAKPLSRKER
jgi:hypothetical protein